MEPSLNLTRPYTRLRRQFGQQPQFCEQGPELCDSIIEDPYERQNYILRNPVHSAVQHTPDFREYVVNTERREYTTTGVNHEEGGWPKDVNINDPESTRRYCHKVERDENYMHCVETIAPSMLHYVKQNNALDLYSMYYSDMEKTVVPDQQSCRTVNVYRDPVGRALRRRSRPVCSVCWQPFGQLFAVSYANVAFDRTPQSRLQGYVWDVENPHDPQVKVGSPTPLLDLQFNPRDANVLAGALMSGQVGAWDVRSPERPSALCPPHVAHRDLTRYVLFIHSKSGQEVFSAGPDGAVKWWDLRNLSDIIDEIITDPVRVVGQEPSRSRAHGVSALEYEHTIPTRFMVGTEDGLVLGGNRKGRAVHEKLPVQFSAQVGPVRSLQRNPWFPRNFLTVGDWTLRVWSEETRESAVIWSGAHRYHPTAAVWSPTRASVMVAARWDGALCVWDLLKRHDAPSLIKPVSAEPLLTLQVHRKGSLVACGSQSGDVYLVELSKSLAVADKNDKTLLATVLARETRREHILDARLREIRLRLRQVEESGPAAPEGLSAGSSDHIATDADLADVTNEYFAEVKKEIAKATA